MENERKYLTNKEKFNIHGSAVIIKTGEGNLLFQLKDADAPTGANKLSAFGGGREQHIDHYGRDFKSRESTLYTAKREIMEELSLTENQISNVKPFGYQSFNDENNPNKGFSVHIAKLSDGVTKDDMILTEGEAIIEGTLEEILARDDLFEPIREMLERNKNRIKNWINKPS